MAWRAYSTGPDKDVLIGASFKPHYEQDRGTDLGVKTWPPEAWKIGGGNVWGWISYDPELDLVFHGTGNPGPWNPQQRPGDNKWTAGIFARRPSTGEAIWFRGNLLFGLGARILGTHDDRIQEVGGLWALVDVARHCSDAPSRELLLKQARTFAEGLAGARFPPALRPLSMLGALAVRDASRGEPFEAEGKAPRAAALLRHRMTGRIPRP